MALSTDQSTKLAALADAFADVTAITNFATAANLLTQKSNLALQIANQRASMVAAQAAGQAILDGLLTQAAQVESALAEVTYVEAQEQSS